MMEWILIVVIVAIIGIALIATGMYYYTHHDRSDYQDGGGIQLKRYLLGPLLMIERAY